MCIKTKQYRNMANWFWGSRRSWRPPENCGERRECRWPNRAAQRPGRSGCLSCSCPFRNVTLSRSSSSPEGKVTVPPSQTMGGRVGQEQKHSQQGHRYGEGPHGFSLLQSVLSPPESGARRHRPFSGFSAASESCGWQTLSDSEVPRCARRVSGMFSGRLALTLSLVLCTVAQWEGVPWA